MPLKACVPTKARASGKSIADKVSQFKNAFSGLAITSVLMPNSITKINEKAFLKPYTDSKVIEAIEAFECDILSVEGNKKCFKNIDFIAFLW